MSGIRKTGWTRFVALGDSLTEGIGDPDDVGGHRGWADRFADALAARHGRLHYANLAVRGRLTAQVAATQLGPALSLRPDLAAVIAGMNDLIRPSATRTMVRRAGEHLDRMVATLTDHGALVLTATLPDPGELVPLPPVVRRRFAGRLAAFNDRVRAIADRRGACLVDMADDRLRDLAGWSGDQLHPGPYGHQRIADEFLAVLTGAPSGVVEPRPPVVLPDVSPVAQARWLATAAGPWLARKLVGRQPWAGVTPKLPAYRLLVPS